MIAESIKSLVGGQEELNLLEVKKVFTEIMQGKASEVQIAAFLVALRMKGETSGEITAAAQVMREFALSVKIDAEAALDTCGTGADRRHTFNISTISALVAAGAGVVVAKHGNRAVTSFCGSADLLEAMGVNINLNAEKVAECIETIGIGFLFAPLLHPAMKNVAAVRRELGVRTIFNLLGPLTNPAMVKYQLLGVYSEKLLKPVASVLKNLGLKHALVVYGDGMDEVATTGPTKVCELKNGVIKKTYEINSIDYGIKKAKLEDLKCVSINDNVKIAFGVLKGEKGPQYDTVILNAGCAIYTADKAKTIRQGIELARKSIDSGVALSKLEELKKYSNT